MQKQNKFFKKFLENISRIDEFNIKQIVELIEDERRTFRRILDLLDEALIVIQGDQIIFLNQMAEKLLKTSHHPIPTRIEDFQDAVENRNLFNYIIQPEFPDFKTDYTQKTNNQLEYYEIEKLTAEPDFSIVKITDVTQQRALEIQLKNLESINALNNLAAGIAHEIKNPLSAIDLHTQLIKKGIERGLIEVSSEVKRYIQIIDEETTRLNKILNDFLLSTRKRELVLKYDDINQFIREILEFLRPEIEKNKIHLITDISRVQKIFFDRDYLRQALINLIKNAIEAMQDSDTRILKVSTYYQVEKDSIAIAISDTGSGIDREQLQKIFEPYYTTRENGTGLGLTIVYKIVKEHGGEIQVNNLKLDGKSHESHTFSTTFTVFLPVSKGTKLIGKQ